MSSFLLFLFRSFTYSSSVHFFTLAVTKYRQQNVVSCNVSPTTLLWLVVLATSGKLQRPRFASSAPKLFYIQQNTVLGQTSTYTTLIMEVKSNKPKHESLGSIIICCFGFEWCRKWFRLCVGCQIPKTYLGLIQQTKGLHSSKHLIIKDIFPSDRIQTYQVLSSYNCTHFWRIYWTKTI